MPIYEYQCSGCGKHFEIFQKISDKPLMECRECKGKLSKLISNCAFHLKGNGWYVTDYKKPVDTVNSKINGKKNEKEERKAETASSETTAETKTETKTEVKKESKSETKTENKKTPSTGGES
jgi:putative FmdB family regulatory protein